MQTLEEFIGLCKQKKWDELISFLSSNIKDMSYKVLVTAVIQSHHPDKKQAEEYGLRIWDNSLSSTPITLFFSALTSAVSLPDFVDAYILAKSPNGLNDPVVGQALRTYIENNKEKLSPWLCSDQVPQSNIDAIRKLFPTIEITKKDRESYYRQQFASQAKARIAFIQERDVVKALFAKLLNLKPYEFKFTMNLPSNFLGINTSERKEGALSFKETISTPYVQETANILELIEISCHFYNYTNMRGCQRGIQVYGSIFDIRNKISSYLALSSQDLSKQDETTAKAFEALKSLSNIKLETEQPNTNEGGLSCR